MHLHFLGMGKPARALLLMTFFVAAAMWFGRLLQPSGVVAGVVVQSANAVDFKKDIEPILESRCYDCHSAATRSAGGLRLDDRAAILKGGKSGPAAVEGKPEESLLLERILSHDTKQRMPKGDDPVPDNEVATLRKWIAGGLAWEASATAQTQEKSRPANMDDGKAPIYPRPATAEQLAFFEKKVRPILVNRCYNCHSDAFKEAGGLRVDIGISIFEGGNEGPVIIPGHPEKSILIQRIKTSNEKRRMPQESKEALPADEVATLEAWIRDGAAWPDETEKLPPTPARLAAVYPKLKEKHWAWQPLTHPSAPTLSHDIWSQGPIDRFVLAGLRAKQLTPVGDADAASLVRRLSYDLTGLPPDPSLVHAFEKDHSQKAYESLVDTLLASPAFGERWGRHWLDIARYAESSGPSRNMPYPNAWRYRDYVIDAVNRDIPYNRFLQEQIAGDLLPAETPQEHDRLLIATGYLALGPKDVNQRFKARYKMDNVDDMIDTVTRSTMAMTVSCARCHDHKFDPIPTKDYYALAGIFTSTDDYVGLSSRMGGASLDYYDPKHLSYLSNAPKDGLVSKQKLDEMALQVKRDQEALNALNKKHDALQKPGGDPLPLTEAEKHERLVIRQRMISTRENLSLANDLGERGYAIHAVHEGKIADTTVRVRGVEEKHGPAVPRGFLSVLNLPNTPVIPADHSGRLELAQWITRPDNPLTTRVYVNRVWQHLLGNGIVSTQDNFGSTGDTPSNPALLDYLAGDFVQHGWSTKKLVREIVLSHSYRLSSDVSVQGKKVDPEDKLVWRHAPRRLEAEEIRDSILATAGDLNRTPPKGSSAMALRMIEVRDDGPAVTSILRAADSSLYRSVYLPLLRDETPRTLAAFDPVTQTLIAGKREVTTVPKQSLFMLNSPFVRQQSKYLADRLLATHQQEKTLTSLAYQRVLGRKATLTEQKQAQSFLARYESTWRALHPAAVIPISVSSSGKERDVLSSTDGIVRQDGLAQDDEVEEGKPAIVRTGEDATTTAELAAWSAFIQALYGSVAFQFLY